MKVYFEIFGKKLVKELDDNQFGSMTDAQIEYWLRGKLNVNKIERSNTAKGYISMPDIIKDIFGAFGNGKFK